MDKPAAPRTLRNRSLHAGVPLRGYLILLLFALVLFWPLCLGRTLYWGDILLYFAPMWRWEQHSLQNGHIPLWNPTILGGQPFVGNPQEGVFYPATLLLPFLPVWLYLSVLTITHVFLCGAFMARYLSRWTRHSLAPIAGGLVYMGSECLIGRVQFPPMIFTAAFFPLLLCSLDGCLDADKAEEATCSPSTYTPSKCVSSECVSSECLSFRVLCLRTRLASRLKLALVVGILALAAHPQMAYLILACGSIYGVARYASQYRHHRIPVRQALTAPLAGLLGLLLTAAQTLPAVQLLLASPREQLTPAQANRFVLEPINLLTLVLPRFRGHPATADFWGSGNAWEPAFFIGWLPLLLIGLACMDGWRRKRTRFWIVGAALGLWLSFGSVGGLYWLAFKTVPGLSNFHDPARFLIYTTFAFAFLTAMGWEAFVRQVRVLLLRNAQFKLSPMKLKMKLKMKSNRLMNTEQAVNAAFSLALLLIAAPLWFYGTQWNPTASHDILDRCPTFLSAQQPALSAENSIASNGRVYLPAHDTLWKHDITDGYSDYGPAEDRHLQAFVDTMLPNIGMADGLRSASGYEPVPIAAPATLDGLGRIALKRGEPNFSRLMALMGADRLLLPATNSFADARLAKQSPSSKSSKFSKFSKVDLMGGLKATPPRKSVKTICAVSWWRNVDALPPAWIVHKTRRVEGKTRIVAALAAPDFQPEAFAIVSDAPQLDEPDLEWNLDWSNKIDWSNKSSAILSADDSLSRKKRAEQTSCVLRRVNSGTTDQEYEANSGAESGMLILSQAAYPGWKTRVDGKPVRMHRVDGALTGVYLPPGHHVVRITYRPEMYRFGLFLTLYACSILCIGVGMWFGMRPLSDPISSQEPRKRLE